MPATRCASSEHPPINTHIAHIVDVCQNITFQRDVCLKVCRNNGMCFTQLNQLFLRIKHPPYFIEIINAIEPRDRIRFLEKYVEELKGRNAKI